MKIITEKIHGEPRHSITKSDVKAIIEVVPDDWIGIAHVFSISSQLFENSNWDRPVIQNGTRFKILSRGIEKNVIIKELLIALAIRPTKTYPPKRHSLTKTQRKKLEDLIEHFYKKITE